MKYISVCSGIEAASVAWHEMGWTPVAFSEIEPFPSEVLKIRFPNTPNWGDMTKYQNWPNATINLLVGGTPCFTLDTPIITNRGIIPIADVLVGDMVFTHKLRWKPVIAIGRKEAETVKLGGHGNSGIETTEEHPFYSKLKNRAWNNDKRIYEHHLSEKTEWIEAKDMVGRFWGIPINGEPLPIPPIVLSGNETHLPIINSSFYWIVGAWLGDGWVRISKRRSYVLICADKNNHKAIAQHLNQCNLKYSISEEKTTIRYQIASSALAKWLVKNFNKGAKNKTMASWVLFGLSEDNKKALFDGYIFADGYNIYNNKQAHNGFGATTISKCLSTGIKLLGASLGYSVGENYCKPKRKITTIDGRRITEQPFYQVRFHSNSRSAVQEGGILWQKAKTYKQTNAIRTVSNIEVADDNSYVAGGIIVHNCQSFSVAGLRQGLKDPRGNLMLTFLGIAQRYKPKWIIWENVPGVLSSNGGKDFGSFLGALGELGYGWAYRVLDAQWFGVAQRRKRVFVVGCLGDQRAAAEVLFESESVSRNPAPSREKRQTAPASTEGGVGEGSKWWDGGQVAATLTKQNANGAQRMPDKDNFGAVLEPVPHAFKVRGGCEGGGKGYLGQDEQAFTISTHQDQNIAVPFRKVRRAQSTEDFETWQQDEVSNTINTFDVGDIRSTNVVAQPVYFDSHPADSRITGPHETASTVNARYGTGGGNTPLVAQPVIIDRAAFNQGENAQYEPKIEEGETMSSLVAKGPHAVAQPVAVDTYSQTINKETTQTIGLSASDVNHYGAVIQNVSPTITQCKGSRGGCSDEAISEIDAIQKAQSTMAIRRLTPVECEKLQGFPNNWTRIPWKKKPEEDCPDGPRYKACGNSMAVPCMKWIGERINKVENKNLIEPLP